SEASEPIWAVRMIKSRFEADMKKASFRIANSAFDAALSEARIGITEAELFRSIQSRIVLNGAERCDPFPVIFSNNEFIYNRRPDRSRWLSGPHRADLDHGWERRGHSGRDESARRVEARDQWRDLPVRRGLLRDEGWQ